MTPKETSLVFLLVTIMLWGKTMAQSGCTTALIGLSPCLSFISGNSSSTPSPSCCSQLSNVVQTQPQCLCSLLNGGGTSFGISINQTLALSLPSACNVQTPPVSRCNGGANTPTSSIAHSPTSTTAHSPKSSTAHSPTANSPTNNSPSYPSNEIPKAPTSATTPTHSATPNSGGSKSIPSKNSDTSDGMIIRTPAHLLVCVFFVVSSISIITKV